MERSVSIPFGLAHPYWRRAVELRQNQLTIYEILSDAREAGFKDLTYNQIAYGLRNAPADLFLPTRTSLKLRQKWADLSSTFNSYIAMKDLAQEAQQKLDEIEEELGNPETTPSRRQFLENQHYRWFGRAFDYAAVIAELEATLGIEAMRQGYEQEDDAIEGEVIDHTAKLLEDFRQRMPTVPQSEMLDQYGTDLIKPPEEDNGDDEETDEDD